MVGFVYSIKTREDSLIVIHYPRGGGGGYFLVAFDVRRMRPNLNARSLGTSI